VREIRMLRAMRRGLETGLRQLLHGHEGGNPGHSQGAAYGLPRQFPTLHDVPNRPVRRPLPSVICRSAGESRKSMMNEVSPNGPLNGRS